MTMSRLIRQGAAVGAISILAGCATWNNMDRTERGTAAGATGGALVGAAVGGPVGAAVGAGAGGYIGHHQTRNADDTVRASGMADGSMRSDGMHAHDDGTVRAVQQALNQRGFDAGPVDGVWGPSTESALRAFQQERGMRDTGTLDAQTMSALGVQGAAAPR